MSGGGELPGAAAAVPFTPPTPPHRARAELNATVLPPLWAPPEPCPVPASGRMRLTPTLRAALVREVELGIPFAVICAAPGWPSRAAMRAWCSRDAAFGCAISDAQQRGGRRLAEIALTEIAERERVAGRYAARKLLQARHKQLAGTHRAHFAGGVWARAAAHRLGLHRAE